MSLTLGITVSCTDGIQASIATLYAIDRDDITDLTLASGETLVYGTENLDSGKTWLTYEFEEDQAEFRQSLEGERGSYKVIQEVEIFVKGLSTAKNKAIQELIDSSTCGMVLIAKDTNGVYWVLGYNEEFGTTRPARIQGMEGGTMKALGEIPGDTLTFRATSTKRAYTATFTPTTA